MIELIVYIGMVSIIPGGTLLAIWLELYVKPFIARWRT